jgi:hypothetical protein
LFCYSAIESMLLDLDGGGMRLLALQRGSHRRNLA